MTNQKGVVPVLIVFMVAMLFVAGFVGYLFLEKERTDNKSVLTERQQPNITSENKNLCLQICNGTDFKIPEDYYHCIESCNSNSDKKEKEFSDDEKSCVAAGGKWGRFGLVNIEQCSLPTKDGGNVCRDSSECEGDCIATITDEQNDALTSGEALEINGTCTRMSLDFFGCHPFVENGLVRYITCVD